MKMHYHTETNNEVKTVLETLNESRERVRIWYGDTGTGISWNEEYAMVGRIGNSTGSQKIPLMITSSRSLGGGAILDHCIIRIDCIKTRKTLYKHPNFMVTLQLQNNSVYDVKTGTPELYATFTDNVRAKNFLDFMKGERYSK